MSTGSAYAFCTGCGCVAVENEKANGPHHWIERVVDANERQILSGIICNVCMPRPDLICEGCGGIGHDVGAGYVWVVRTPTRRELHRLTRQRCPNCTQQAAANAL
ncbi:MAG: hypothetical protein AAB974_04435 [Patescibacteria group bacterium]